MLAILGGSGYVGSAFVRTMRRNNIKHEVILRNTYESAYQNPNILASVLKDIKCDFLINCAGYVGKPNVDACELNKADCLMANAVLPSKINEVCKLVGIPWGHVSSGCLYDGLKDGGYTENDPPNFCFGAKKYSYYSATKALCESMLVGNDCYIWRLRVPFNNINNMRNFLTKILVYEKLLDVENSLSHLDEFVVACLDCWNLKVPFGIYNMTNGGSITTRRITEILSEYGYGNEFEFFGSEDEFMQHVRTPRSSCNLDNSKAINAGLKFRPVEDAIIDSVENFIVCSRIAQT